MSNRTPTQVRMKNIASLIGHSLRRTPDDPLMLPFSRLGWKLIRQALNKASKPK